MYVMLRILCVASCVSLITNNSLKAMDNNNIRGVDNNNIRGVDNNNIRGVEEAHAPVSQKRVGLRVVSSGTANLNKGTLEIIIKGINSSGVEKEVYRNSIDLGMVMPSGSPAVLVRDHVKLNINFKGINKIVNTVVMLKERERVIAEGSYKGLYSPDQVNGYSVAFGKLEGETLIVPTSDEGGKEPIEKEGDYSRLYLRF